VPKRPASTSTWASLRPSKSCARFWPTSAFASERPKRGVARSSAEVSPPACAQVLAVRSLTLTQGQGARWVHDPPRLQRFDMERHGFCRRHGFGRYRYPRHGSSRRLSERLLCEPAALAARDRRARHVLSTHHL